MERERVSCGAGPGLRVVVRTLGALPSEPAHAGPLSSLGGKREKGGPLTGT